MQSELNYETSHLHSVSFASDLAYVDALRHGSASFPNKLSTSKYQIDDTRLMLLRLNRIP